MKKLIALLIILLSGIPATIAGDWQKTYVEDEFGDPDYSKPAYVIRCVDPTDYDIIMKIIYYNGVLVLEPTYYSADVERASSIKAKSRNGQVYQLKFDKPHKYSNLHIISDEDDVNTLVNLLEQGNFILSLQRPADYVKEAYNYNFRIGKQGQGIRNIFETDFPPMLSHEDQGKPDMYKGTIGKYPITMLLRFDSCSPSNPDVFPASGEYWYGSGKNGKMTLKGTLTYVNKERIIKLDEYDPNGKKCGSFILKEIINPRNYDTEKITGTMKNVKGTVFTVNLLRQ